MALVGPLVETSSSLIQVRSLRLASKTISPLKYQAVSGSGYIPLKVMLAHLREVDNTGPEGRIMVVNGTLLLSKK